MQKLVKIIYLWDKITSKIALASLRVFEGGKGR